MKHNQIIYLLIFPLVLFSCKENVLKKHDVIKETKEIKTKKTKKKVKIASKVCDYNKWAVTYINNLNVIQENQNNNKAIDRNYGSLLLEKQNFYIGYIGPNKKRIQIFFNKTVMDTLNKLKYHVKGYTIVGENKRNFKGYITIDSIYKLKEFTFGVDNWMKGKVKNRGVVLSHFYLTENSQYSATGVFEGICIIKWYINNNDILKYDDIEDDSDSYSNNQFIGTWTSYKTDKSRICAWGQYRIPCSGDLDIGAAEFYPNEKYLKYGWKDYVP